MVVLWTLVLLGYGVMALPCNVANGPFKAQQSLFNTVAVIGPDDRRDRESGDLPENIEAAQARFWCPTAPLRLKAGRLADRNELVGAVISNATIAFEDDFALINRHPLIKENGQTGNNPKKCYIEHIKSGLFMPIIDAEYPAYKDHSKNMYTHQDIALVRLAQKLPPGSALKDDMFMIDENPNIQERVTVVSNWASNRTNHESLTITECKRYGLYKLADGRQSNSFGTDCDTGGGSSAAQAYLFRDNRPKMFGIVSSEMKKVPEGGSWDAAKLSTRISKFDSSLFDSVAALRARSMKNSATSL